MESDKTCLIHKKQIHSVCIKEDCTNQLLCTLCFQKHDPTHSNYYMSIEDLSAESVEKLINEMRDRNSNEIQNFNDESEKSVNNYISKIRFKKFDSFKNNKITCR